MFIDAIFTAMYQKLNCVETLSFLVYWLDLIRILIGKQPNWLFLDALHNDPINLAN